MSAKSRALVVAAVLALLSSLLLPVNAAAGTESAGQPSRETAAQGGEIEVVRLWGQDRYETSLAVAQEIVRLRGGRAETVVLAASRSVHYRAHQADDAYRAAIAASLAGGLDAPMLYVPADGLSPEAIALLTDSGVRTALVVGSPRTLPATELLSVIRAGIRIERVLDPVAAAQLVGFPEYEGVSAGAGSSASEAPNATQETGADSRPVRAVVLAHGVASPAAAALAARAKLPLLDFPQQPLADDATAQFIRDHGVTHALVLDGHDRLRSPGGSLAQLGVELVPVGGSDLFGAAVASAQFTSDEHAGRFDALSQRDCHSQASPTIGLAAGRNVNSFRSERTDAVISWDAYSAAPLLGWLCSPLLLTHPHGLSVDANAVLYRAQQTGTASVHVIGGIASVRESVAVHAASPDVPVRAAIAIADPRSDSGDRVIAVIDERQQVRHYMAGDGFSYIREMSWSPLRRHIAFTGHRDGAAGVFVLEFATEDVWRLTPANSSYSTVYNTTLDWSSDGVLLAMSVYPYDDINNVESSLEEVAVADVRDKSIPWLTRNEVPDLHHRWSPQGHRLLVSRAPRRDWYWTVGTAAEIEVVDIDTGERVPLAFSGIATQTLWSPDGQNVGIVTYENPTLYELSSRGTVQITKADGTETATVAGHSGSINEWSPNGCCIAAWAGVWAADIQLIDASAGTSRQLTEQLSSYRRKEGPWFRGWSPDSQFVVASDLSHDQGIGIYTTELFAIDVDSGRRWDLPFSSLSAKFRYGGFSPDGTRALYAATDLDELTHQLIAIEPNPDGEAEVVLDATALFDQLTIYPEVPKGDVDYVEPIIWFNWPQLSWTEYGIGAVAEQSW